MLLFSKFIVFPPFFFASSLFLSTFAPEISNKYEKSIIITHVIALPRIVHGLQ